MSVLLIATLDTKGTEAAYVRDRLRSAGVAVTVLDAGVLGVPAFAADISREAVFLAAGANWEALKAAAAMAGMVTVSREPKASAADKPLIAATMFGVTTPCVETARKILEAAGYEVLVFHATGAGGRTMEGLIRDGLIAGVLDITTTELADELAGGVLSAGPDRLTAAGLAGVPQVISVGALDLVNFGPPGTTPERYQDRRFYRHNPTVTLMRTTADEMAKLGAEIGRKASAATGPTAVMLPLRGVSAIDADGKPFWRPEADAALF